MSLKSSLQNKYTAAKSVFQTNKGKLSGYSKAAITIAVIILILGIIFGLINNRNRSINIKEIETTVNQIMSEQEQLVLEQAKKERAEAAKQEQLVLEQAKKERAEAAKQEQLALEQAEKERAEAAEQEQLALEQAEKERAEAAEQEQLALEQAEKERAEAAEQEQLALEQAEKERAEAAEQEQLALEQAEKERAEAAEQEQLALEQAEKERAEAAEQEQLALEQAEKEITEAIAKDGSDVLNDEKYQESIALLEKNTISIILRRGQAPYPRLAIEKDITAVCTSSFTITQEGLAENIETSCDAKMYRNQFRNSSQRSIKGSLFERPEPNQRKLK